MSSPHLGGAAGDDHHRPIREKFTNKVRQTIRLAFGAIRQQPWVVTDKHGKAKIKPRWVTTLGLSFDHRLIDGELGSKFLRDIGRVLADPVVSLV